MNWREFRPTILFLLKFLGLYLIGNLVYGIYITSYEPRPDPITQWVTDQTAEIVSLLGWSSETVNYKHTPTVSIVHEGKSIVSVYEGCNGVNVMIIFLVFLISFGPWSKKMYWFVPLGLVIIHLVNLLRIGLLFFVSIQFPRHLYFMHKYFFTAFIYRVVLVLWFWWVKKVSLHDGDEDY
jgi:exosortase family protein XrtF